MKNDKELILWIDIETTGLDAGKDLILEIAYAITPINASEILYQDAKLILQDKRLSSTFLNFLTLPRYSFVRNMHVQNGLIQDLLDDRIQKVPLTNVAEEIKEQLSKYESHTIYLGGSSVHTDRKHIEAHRINLPVSHRHVDVTSLSLFAKAAKIGFHKTPANERNHRALDDIQEDIKAYRKFVIDNERKS